jgi:hypothetical protein
MMIKPIAAGSRSGETMTVQPFAALLFAALVFGASAPASAQAQPDGEQGQVQKSAPTTSAVNRAVTGQAGRDIRIGVFASLRSDCTTGTLPVIRLKAEPKHGKVRVRQGKLRATNHPRCLAAEVPAFVVLYRSAPDFEGKDEVELEIVTGTRVQIQRIVITVSDPKGVQKI